jgi:hypothetical protein
MTFDGNLLRLGAFSTSICTWDCCLWQASSIINMIKTICNSVEVQTNLTKIRLRYSQIDWPKLMVLLEKDWQILGWQGSLFRPW